MRFSEKAGYAAIAEVLCEPLASIGPIEAIIEDVCRTVADQGCGVTLPGGLAEYRRLIDRRRI